MSRRDDPDDSDDWDSEDEEEREGDRLEAIQRKKADMTDEQRHQFDLFNQIRLPQTQVKDMMTKAINGVPVQKKAAAVAAYAGKLFLADLIETARRLSGNKDPLTPDLILMAYNEIEESGRVPGKGSGMKRTSMV